MAVDFKLQSARTPIQQNAVTPPQIVPSNPINKKALKMNGFQVVSSSPVIKEPNEQLNSSNN
jgi:hypothetical protein